MLAGTNLLLALGQWTSLTTNVLSGSGNFTTTNAMNPNVSALYFNLEAY